MSKCLPSPWDPGSQDINFLLNFGYLVHFRPGRLYKNVIITWPALGLMGISGPSGVLMLPSGLRPLGSIKTPSGPEIPMIPRAGHVIMSHFPPARWRSGPEMGYSHTLAPRAYWPLGDIKPACGSGKFTGSLGLRCENTPFSVIGLHWAHLILRHS